MKGIILHGGYGTRLGPLTFSKPKQLLQIANKPMSQYALDDLKNAGIREIAIVIGDIYPEKVKDFYGNGSNFGVNIKYIFQSKPLGISHAIKLCEEFIGDEKFIVYLGDNIMRKNLGNFAKSFESSSDDCKILLCEVDNPSRFGIAEFKNNKILKIIEKPKETNSNLAVIGIYFFNKKIFKIIENLKPSWRGELEVTDALQLSLQNGHSISYETVTGWWKDTGTPEDILDANKLILETLGTGDLLNSEVLFQNKKISIATNTEIDSDVKITEPVIIGKNCLIKNTQIGPYVSIGDNVSISGGKIENSIIMNDCILNIKNSIKSSIISNNSEINDTKSFSYQFLLGEKSKIQL
jgi:glucose-1-phosphate thymidylyltransferase